MIENNEKRESNPEKEPEVSAEKDTSGWRSGTDSEYSYCNGETQQFEVISEEPPTEENGAETAAPAAEPFFAENTAEIGAVPTEENPQYRQGKYAPNGVQHTEQPSGSEYRQERKYTYSNNEWNFNSYEGFDGEGKRRSSAETTDEGGYGYRENGNNGGYPSDGGYPGGEYPRKPRKSNGVKIFAGILCGVIVLALVCFAGYGVWSMLGREELEQSEEQSGEGYYELPPVGGDEEEQDGESGFQSSAADMGIEIDREHSGIAIEDRPAEEGTGEVVLPWTVEVAEKVSPAVVGIEIYLEDFTQEEGVSPVGSGTGIIMSEDGYIITNAHVVAGAYAIKVTLSDGSEYPAATVGSDTITDLAVIRIEAKGLPAAEFGNSDQMKVGEFVIAIGNPGGLSLQGSVTYGMVSAVNREIRTDNSTLVCIQTDAAINPGNSGGALVNQYGQVVGINSAKIAVEGFEGIGFAIASNHAQPIIDELIRYGRVTGRIQLGITAQLITPANAMYNGVEPGMYIVDITNQSMIDSGVKVGDIITHINGKEVTSFNGVSEQLAVFKAGDKVTLTVYRPATKTSAASTFEAEISLVQDLAD
ncbi:MAG: trypsin-like serine protease [Ruminococcaceae bacterium]|nr:trypsin-like serine protease [Oscillospiraceae bacterium]